MELTPKSITVLYYAIFQEQAKRAKEDIETLANTLDELYIELQQKYSFTLKPDMVRFAVNDEFQDSDYLIQKSDIILLVAPVAGG